MHPIIFGVMVFVVQATESPFNSYKVFLSQRTLPGACATGTVEEFRNRTYTFDGDVSSPVTLRDGKFVDSPLGTPEFETSLDTAETVKTAGRVFTLLIIGSQHVHALGGRT